MRYEMRYMGKEDEKAKAAAGALLARAGLLLEDNLERTLGVYDQSGQLVATGSALGSTLRCLAVDSAHQGEGLMARLISKLTEDLFLEGVSHLFVYASPQSEEKLLELGFYPIARVPGALVFMENRREGFLGYLKSLGEKAAAEPAGAVILNANPFTRGHRYLVEKAANQCGALHLFVVSEDLSFFPFEVRRRLVKAGTSGIQNIIYHDTGSYLISRAVFPAYFLKEEAAVTRAQAALDAQIFAQVARRLNITRRFVGEEPFSPATHLYNQEMAARLPGEGIMLQVIRRLDDPGGTPLSATRVRQALKAGDEKALTDLLPKTTLAYLKSEEGQALIKKRLAETE